MLVTELGIVIEVRLEQLQKADFPMLVTEFGIIVFLHPTIKTLELVVIMALQSFLESNLLFSFSTIIEVKLKVFAKTKFPILVTEFGIVTDVRPVQPLNA